MTQPESVASTPFRRYREALAERFYAAQPVDRVTEIDSMTAQNLSMPSDDFRRLGGFDDGFTIASCEDWDLALRARRAGIRILYHPGIVVMHDDWAVSLDRFCERQRLYSISDVLLWKKYGAVSPRAGLVAANGPISWYDDSPRLVVKKSVKRALASRSGERVVRACCRVSERLVPDSRWTQRTYDAAVALAIFRGVREGFERYGFDSGADIRGAKA